MTLPPPPVLAGGSSPRATDPAPTPGARRGSLPRGGDLRSSEAVERRVSEWLVGTTDPRRSQVEELLAEGLPGQGSKYRGLRVVLKGVLQKRGKFNTAFKGRLFLLTEDGCLHYLASKSGRLAPGDKVHSYECTHKKTIHIGAATAVRDGGFGGGMYRINATVDSAAAAAAAAAGPNKARRFEFATPDKETYALWLTTLLRIRAMGLEPPQPPKVDADAPAGSGDDGSDSDGSD
jgi:hypothetical protein